MRAAAAQIEIYTWDSGTRYEGQRPGGVANGKGVHSFADGDRYEGDWKDGKKHGEGTYFCKATETKLVGTYVKGELTYGTFSDKFGATFTGSFANGDYGEGAWRLASGAAA